MNEEKIKEILKELVKPKKFEVGFVEAQRTINDGLIIIGMNATDILGFAKEPNETRIRRTRGSQAWFKKMYEDGWRYAGNFEYEGLYHKGFVVMERELPNKRLEQLIETLTDERVIRTGSALEIDRGPELPKLLEEAMSSKSIPYIPLEKTVVKQLYKDEMIGPVYKAKVEEKALEAKRKILEPKEGFDSEINDLIGEGQEHMKSLAEIFFDKTGKNAIWRGNETKAFKNWKENLSD